MRVVTSEQMGKIDRTAIEEFGIPGIILMENAALKVVEEVERTLNTVFQKKILIFGGKGNNGGDAFAVARHLFNKGAKIIVYVLADRNSIKGDAGINLRILDKMDVKTFEITDSEVTDSNTNVEFNTELTKLLQQLEAHLKSADLIVDGIFGTGLKGKIKGIASYVISMINTSLKTIISIDIPSGINGTTGKIEDVCIKADKTVTFAFPKLGLILYPGCNYVGDIIVADIGIPLKAIGSTKLKTEIINKDAVIQCFPQREKETNKGNYGKVLIISGSKGMTGSGCLAAKAAHRSGAGLVYLAVPKSLAPIYSSALIETITMPLEDECRGHLIKENINAIGKYMDSKDVIAVGPGLSLNNEVIKVVHWIIENSTVPLVLDADALNAIAVDVSILKKLKTTAIITPHPGEMARLIGKTVQEVQENRVDVAKEFSCKWGLITVLKGWRTVVSYPDGKIHVNLTGNPGMATAGTGDVLTGLIAGLIAQGISSERAAYAGAYIHGLAGDRAAIQIGEYGIIASDLIKELPFAIKAIT